MKKVTSPLEFFGFEMGADRELARWDKIVEYFERLKTESDCIEVIEVGKSTEDNPFLLVIISAAKNLANLENLRQLNLKLSDPRGLDEATIDSLIGEGKAVICQSMSLHATEVGGTQMAPELAFDLLSREDDEAKRILDNVIFLMVPCFNPDGQIMVTDWYYKTLGTEYEGSNLPWLYQKYTGHDNNRDAFSMNIVESQHMGKILFRDWKPQAYQDHHHMMVDGARFAIAPYCDPIRPNTDPLIWREHSWYGAHMAYKLEEQGKTGIINAAMFPGWGHLGFHWITNFHNIAGMLTESASAKLATPLYIHPSQLVGGGRFSPKSWPEYEAQTNFPHPWEGGWWRLRDVVEQKKISAWALLDIAARNKETVLTNAYLKASRQTERGANDETKAYAIRPDQHDELTTRKLVRALLNQGIEVKRASEAFVADDCNYPAGTWIVSLAQPKMGLIKALLGQTTYIDNYFSRRLDGSPGPFDASTDTLNEFMGVAADPIGCCPDTTLEIIDSVEDPGTVANSDTGWTLDGRLNDAYKVVNRLLKAGVTVCRGTEEPLFYVEPHEAAKDILDKAAAEIGICAEACPGKPVGKAEPLTAKRIGMYQRYYSGNMDEGWTRFLFDNWEYDYTTLLDKDITAGNLNDKYDVIILPSDYKDVMIDLSKADPSNPRMQQFFQFYAVSSPPEYRSGFGEAGVEALKAFVENGGRLVTFGMACEFSIDVFNLGLNDATKGLKETEYFCQGSTLHATADNTDPVGWGMPSDFLAFNYESLVFGITEKFNPDKYRVIAKYAKKDLLRSGWLIGEEHITDKATVVATEHGKGELVLIGLRPQHRCQTHGTFKFVFNCLY